MTKPLPPRDRHKHNKLHIISGSYMIPEIFLNPSYRRANYSVVKDQKNCLKLLSQHTGTEDMMVSKNLVRLRA